MVSELKDLHRSSNSIPYLNMSLSVKILSDRGVLTFGGTSAEKLALIYNPKLPLFYSCPLFLVSVLWCQNRQAWTLTPQPFKYLRVSFHSPTSSQCILRYHWKAPQNSNPRNRGSDRLSDVLKVIKAVRKKSSMIWTQDFWHQRPEISLLWSVISSF